MKFSQFNIYTDSIIEDYLFTYNLLHGTYALIRNSAKDNFSNIKKQEINELYKRGLVVEDDIDEYDVYQYWNMYARFRDDCLYFTMLPTDNCNLRCAYCYQNNVLEKKPSRTMSRETVEKFISFCETARSKGLYSTIDLSFFGGEPLLAMNVVTECAKYVKDNWEKHTMSITTNGTLLNSHILNTLYENGVRRIQISVDGTEAIHNKRRNFGDKNCYNIILNNIELALEKGFLIIVAVNIDNENKDSIDGLLEELSSRFSKEIRKNLYIAFGFIFDTPKSLNHCATHLVADEVRVEILEHLLSKLDECGLKLASKPGFGACTYESLSMLVVDAGGEVYNCVSGVGLERFLVGDLDTYNGNRMWMMRGEIVPLKEKCKTCNMLPVCKGGCKYKSYTNEGKRKEIFCQQKNMEQLYSCVTKYLYEEELIKRSISKGD